MHRVRCAQKNVCATGECVQVLAKNLSCVTRDSGQTRSQILLSSWSQVLDKQSLRHENREGVFFASKVLLLLTSPCLLLHDIETR